MGRGLDGRTRPRARRLDGLVQTWSGRTSSSHTLSKLEQRIFDDFVVPLIQEDMDTLTKNEALLLYYREQLEKTSVDKYFIDILDFVGKGIDIMGEIKGLRSKAYGADGLGQLYVRTARMRLLPEYEVYNAVVGAPDIRNNEGYSAERLERIRVLLRSVDPAELDYAMLSRVIGSNESK
jgi:hypothetical protein